MNRQDFYIRTIRRCCPQLEVETVRLERSGQYNDAMVVNEALVFRFAKTNGGGKSLQRETTVLRAVQRFITLNVPGSTFFDETPDSGGAAFMGYELTPGCPLSVVELNGITDDGVMDRLAGQLALFLRESYQVPKKSISTDFSPRMIPGSTGRRCMTKSRANSSSI